MQGYQHWLQRPARHSIPLFEARHSLPPGAPHRTPRAGQSLKHLSQTRRVTTPAGSGPTTATPVGPSAGDTPCANCGHPAAETPWAPLCSASNSDRIPRSPAPFQTIRPQSLPPITETWVHVNQRLRPHGTAVLHPPHPTAPHTKSLAAGTAARCLAT